MRRWAAALAVALLAAACTPEAEEATTSTVDDDFAQITPVSSP